MKIPFVDLKAQYQSIKKDIDAAIENVISETAFIGGKYVQVFEEQFAAMYGVKHCISCANGTDSLYIIMKMLGIGKGDEVITVTNSWISSSETISQTGATPVFIDTDEFFTINSTAIEAAITANTKAIIPVHLYGQMCNIETIMAIANKHNIYVIEDCAQSHFSVANHQLAGTFGIAASFSFYPGKNLGAYGDAGCIITNNYELATKCKMYARHGALVKHQHKIEGINSRLDGMQAAILSAKLPHILEWTEKRIANALLYNNALAGIPQVIVPTVRPNTKHTFHLYVILCQQRDALVLFLKEKGIETAIHYPTPLHAMEAYNYLQIDTKKYPLANHNQQQILSLPMYPELAEEQIQYIAQQIQLFYNQ